jgi:cell division protein FtsW
MGKGTPLTLGREMSRQKANKKVNVRRAGSQGIDLPLILIVIVLIIFGMLMVYSASTDYSIMILGENPNFMFIRQLRWLALGIVLAAVAAWFNYRWFQKIAVFGMGFTIILLIAVLVNNEVINNAARTFYGGSGQPSELAKIMLIIYLSVWLFAKRDQLTNVNFGLVPLGVILGLIGGLIVLQPDLSAAMTILLIGGLLFFLAGSDLRQIAILLILGVVVGYLVFRVHPTGRERLDAYFIGLRDITQTPDHLSRALEAIVKGGWFGVGIGQADTKYFGLPVPPTDSIFAVITEETGILGAALVILLFTLLMWRGLVIAQRAPDGLGKLLAAGISLWLAMEAFINMAVLVGLVPFAGNALPFISAGGSNLTVSLIGIGILLNISRQSEQNKAEHESVLDGIVNLSWSGRRKVRTRPIRNVRLASKK